MLLLAGGLYLGGAKGAAPCDTRVPRAPQTQLNS